MKKVIAGLVMAISVAGGVQAAGDSVAGKAKAAVCAGCHGADGNSAVPTFPRLAGQGERYLLKQMRDIKDVKAGTRVVPEMTGILDNLSEQDMADVAAYFAAQTAGFGQANPELAVNGQALYRGGNMALGVAACTACHAPTGAGNAPAAFPRLGGQHADYVAKQLKDFRAGTRTNDGDTRMMRDVAARLSDAEIDALASYVQGLH